jgi:hypothetical protein
MVPLAKHLKTMVFEEIKSSRWVRTAPFSPKKLKIRILGVEDREYRALIGGIAQRPAIIAEATLGGHVGTFRLLLPNLGEAYLENERLIDSDDS